MPEMRFRVRWPDDSVSSCYSPSLVIKDFFEVGKAYPLVEFVKRSREALTIASDRVRQKYGFACSAAADELASIESKAARFPREDSQVVQVLAFDE